MFLYFVEAIKILCNKTFVRNTGILLMDLLVDRSVASYFEVKQ